MNIILYNYFNSDNLIMYQLRIVKFFAIWNIKIIL